MQDIDNFIILFFKFIHPLANHIILDFILSLQFKCLVTKKLRESINTTPRNTDTVLRDGTTVSKEIQPLIDVFYLKFKLLPIYPLSFIHLGLIGISWKSIPQHLLSSRNFYVSERPLDRALQYPVGDLGVCHQDHGQHLVNKVVRDSTLLPSVAHHEKVDI